jgi:hypothetical protein
MRPATLSHLVFSKSDPPTMKAKGAKTPRTIENKTMVNFFIDVSTTLLSGTPPVTHDYKQRRNRRVHCAS